jgi:hypothetical protein
VVWARVGTGTDRRRHRDAPALSQHVRVGADSGGSAFAIDCVYDLSEDIHTVMPSDRNAL